MPALLLPLMGDAWGADSSLRLRRLDRNGAADAPAPPVPTPTPLRMQFFESIETTGGTASPPPAPAEVSLSLTLGAAQRRDESGDHALDTPFLVDINQGAWDFIVGGSGYGRHVAYADANGTPVAAGLRTTGLQDIYGLVSYTWKKGDWIVVPGYTFTAPTHGDVGSNHASHEFDLAVRYNLGTRWSVTASGLVNRVNAVDDGAKRYSGELLGKLQYAWTKDFFVYGGVKRSLPNSGGSSTRVLAELDHPLTKKLGIAVVLSRGITSGHRFKAGEVDLIYAF